MATTDPLEGFILKKEACASYDRSLRQLGRDFDKALVRKDTEMLSAFRLRLEDGTVLSGSEISKEQIQKLRDRGLNPTWFVSETWMLDTYGLRKKESMEVPVQPPEVAAQAPEAPAADPVPATTANTDDLLVSKDELIAVLREETSFLRDTLTKERERSKEDKELTHQLHILLKNMQDRLLPAPGASSGSFESPATPMSPKPVESDQKGEDEQNPRPAPVDVVSHNSKAAQTPKSTEPKHGGASTGTTHGRGRRDKKTASKRAPKKPATKRRRKAPPKKPKWNEFPTFKRVFKRK